MKFYTESSGYEKTALSDLQGAWLNLQDTMLSLHPFPDSERIIFHLNEAISWESVRNLKHMKDVYLLIRNMCLKSEMSEKLKEDLDQIKDCLEAAIEDFGRV